MSTIEQVKLSNAGDELVMEIEKAEQVPVGRYPEYSFIGRDGDRDVDLRVPKQSADRQLARLELTLPAVVGKTLRFSRGENKSDPSKPYWNIDVVSGAKAAKGNGTGGASNGAAAITQPAATTQAPATAEPTEKEKASAMYKRMTQFVLDDIVPLYKRAGIVPTGNDVHAMVSTLFINANGRR